MTNNKNKGFPKWLSILIVASGIGVTLLLLILLGGRTTPGTSQKDATFQSDRSTSAVISSEQSYGLPTRLIIKKINVDTNITLMGLTSSGDMEAPRTNEESGWYKYGPHPGDVGSAVIAGHLGVGSGAVFAQLNALEKGDVVSVLDDRNQTISFVVTQMRTYEYNAEPKEVFNSITGAHLNLITCNGDWNPKEKTYSKRLVVFTDKL